MLSVYTSYRLLNGSLSISLLNWACKNPQSISISGLNITCCPLYLTEISPKKIRGAIGTCHQLAITIGISVSQILGLKELFGKSFSNFILIKKNLEDLLYFLLFYILTQSANNVENVCILFPCFMFFYSILNHLSQWALPP